MLGHIMSIMIFFVGIYQGIFNIGFGYFLSLLMIIYWIIGMIWDNVKFNDPLKDWKDLFNLFKDLHLNSKEKNESNL